MAEIQTPRGSISHVQRRNGSVTAEFRFNRGFGREMSSRFSRAQKFVDSEVLRLCDPRVPFRTGMLKKSGILGTVVGSGLVRYNAPYARKNYYENRGNGIEGKNKGGKRGKLWFEDMKKENLPDIIKGARKITRQR